MAGSPNDTQRKVYETPSTIQTLRALAQSNLTQIEAEDEAEALQQVNSQRELQKYAKVKRKDRPKDFAAAVSPPPPPETKGARLRSAQDVLDRLRHDPAFKLAEYWVGYLERFEDIKEMPVRSWISESTDEDWIPQHRIKYVKHVDGMGAEEVVWDRETKIDKVFGSGNGRTTLVGDEGESELLSEAGGVVLMD